MAPKTDKPNRQKPFRCSIELEADINKARVSEMLRTGERISENKFLIQLIKLGLTALDERISQTNK